MKKRNKMLLITSMVLAACGSLCLGRSLTTLPGKECPPNRTGGRIRNKGSGFRRNPGTQKGGGTGCTGTNSAGS